MNIEYGILYSQKITNRFFRKEWHSEGKPVKTEQYNFKLKWSNIVK